MDLDVNSILFELFFLILFLCILAFLFLPNRENDYLELKYRELPIHIERNFFSALKNSAIEHEYKGFLFKTRFLSRRLLNHILQSLSKILPYSGIRVALQKLRGVKVGKRVHIGPSVTIDDVYPNYVVISDGVSLAGLNFIISHSKPLEYHKYLSKSYLAGQFDEDNVRYIRITNLDSTNHIALVLKNENNDEFGVKVDKGCSFLYCADLAGGVADTMDSADAAGITPNSFGDLVDITCAADTAACDVEVFVAST